MTPFHLPSIRSSVASTAQPGRWAKFRRFMGCFPIVSKRGLYPRIYSTCQYGATATIKAKAFSSEVGTGSCEENASNREPAPLVLIIRTKADDDLSHHIGDHVHESRRIQKVASRR